MTEQELRELKAFADVLRSPLNYPGKRPLSALDKQRLVRLLDCALAELERRRPNVSPHWNERVFVSQGTTDAKRI